MYFKEDIYQLLDERHIPYEKIDHSPAYTIEDLAKFHLPHQESIVKNLFVRDDKKKHFYLIVTWGHKQLNMKDVQHKINSRRLSFASEDLLQEKLCLSKGHVTPLACINNEQHDVELIFDEELKDQRIGIHPLENNATIFIKVSDLISLIQEFHSFIRFVAL